MRIASEECDFYGNKYCIFHILVESKLISDIHSADFT